MSGSVTRKKMCGLERNAHSCVHNLSQCLLVSRVAFQGCQSFVGGKRQGRSRQESTYIQVLVMPFIMRPWASVLLSFKRVSCCLFIGTLGGDHGRRRTAECLVCTCPQAHLNSHDPGRCVLDWDFHEQVLGWGFTWNAFVRRCFQKVEPWSGKWDHGGRGCSTAWD